MFSVVRELDSRLTILPDDLGKCVGSCQVSRSIRLDDADSFQTLCRPRNRDDYTYSGLVATPNTLPVNVLRQLASNDSRVNLLDLREELEPVDVVGLSIALIGWQINDMEDKCGPIVYPMHVATNFTYKTDYGSRVRVYGPVFVSTLHPVMNSELNPREKYSIVDHTLSSWRFASDHTVIGFPSKNSSVNKPWLDNLEPLEGLGSEFSATHHMLLHAETGWHLNNQVEIEGSPYTYYHLSCRPDTVYARWKLAEDERFIQACTKITAVWDGNFKREVEIYDGSDEKNLALQVPQALGLLAQMTRMRFDSRTKRMRLPTVE